MRSQGRWLQQRDWWVPLAYEAFGRNESSHTTPSNLPVVDDSGAICCRIGMDRVLSFRCCLTSLRMHHGFFPHFKSETTTFPFPFPFPSAEHFHSCTHPNLFKAAHRAVITRRVH